MRNQKNKIKILSIIIAMALFSGVFFNSRVVQGADLTWVQRTLPVSAVWQSVAYGNGTFVAIAYNSNIAATSPDGINWTQRTMPSSGYWYSIAYGNGYFVAIATNYSNKVAVSTDGINWTAKTLPYSMMWQSVNYGDGKFVALSYSNGGYPTNLAAISTDNGNTWGKIEYLPFSASWTSAAYGDGKFVAVASTSGSCATSEDGVVWTQRTMPVSTTWGSVNYGNGIFVAMSKGSSRIAATSSDGIDWTQRTMPSGSWQYMTFGNGMFVATSTIGSAVSSDGINWTTASLPSVGNWYSIAYGSGTFATLSANSSIAATAETRIVYTGTDEVSNSLTPTDVNLGLDPTISLTCTDSVTMGIITGTGESDLSTNDATCIVSTANSSGYQLTWQAATAYLENGIGDQISAYTPTISNTPETWSVSATESEWGAKLKSSSTTYNSSTWGNADTYIGGNWLNVATSPFQIITRTDETTQSGDSEIITFGAEIGSNKFQPTGTYDTDVVITATTL